MGKLFPIEQKLFDLSDGHVVAVTRVKATSVNDNWVDLPSAASDAKILYITGQTQLAAAGFYLGQGLGTQFGSAKVTLDDVANIDGTTAGTEFLIVSRHANIKNSGSD